MSTPTVVPVEVVKATVPEKVANSNGSGMATTIASVIPKAGSNGTESELSANLLRAGDEIVVNFSDTPTPILPLSITVKDDGTVTIIYNQSFQAAGKTLGALQNDIHERYVPVYFKFLTVNLTTQRRFFTVGGEVKSPNRYEYSGKMTVLGAIATSGGFTDFSKKGKIQVTRSNGKTIMVDGIKALKNSELNIEIFPGDRIDVEKRGF
jgi:protein involved in polysaccharide export with SLBB domain